MQATTPEPESLLDSLSSENQGRIVSIVEGCLEELEKGNKIDVDQLLDQNPDLSDALKMCLASLVSLHDAVHGNDKHDALLPRMETGECLGEFQLGDTLGCGGMGVVYRAFQTTLKRHVALKVLPKLGLSSDQKIKRFLNEAQLAAQLHHPHIVPILAVGETGTAHYFAMTLIDGDSLDRAAQREWDKDNYQEFLRIAIDIADAIDHAHGMGIIHRDIKPSNILLDKNQHVWVTDFGLARYIAESSLTQSGDLVGTIRYMSPEQIEGRVVDERTDVFSLGLTLYEIVTGHVAFPEGLQRRLSSSNSTPIAPRKLCPKIPRDLETILLKSMSTERDLRYGAMHDMIVDLKAFQQGLPIQGRRATPLQKCGRWVVRHHRLALTVFALTMSLSILLAIGTVTIWNTKSKLAVALEQSEENLQLANKNYETGRRMLDRWSKQILDELDDSSGNEPLRARMLQDVIQYYSTYLEQATDADHLKEEMLIAQLRLAEAKYEMGEIAESAELYRRSIDSFQARQDNSLPLDERLLGWALNNLGMAYQRLGENEKSIQAFQAAIDVHDRLCRLNPEAFLHLTDLATSHLNLASVAEKRSHPPQDLSQVDGHLQQSRKLHERALKINPDSDLAREGLALTLDHLASHHAETNLDQAIDYSQSALRWSNQVQSLSTNNLPELARLGTRQHNAGILLARKSRLEEALQCLENARETRVQLTTRAPLPAQSYLDLATTLNTIGMLSIETGNEVQAREAFTQGEQVLKAWLAKGQSSNSIQFALAGICMNRVVANQKAKLPSTQEDSAILRQATKILGELQAARLSDLDEELLDRLKVQLASLVNKDFESFVKTEDL